MSIYCTNQLLRKQSKCAHVNTLKLLSESKYDIIRALFETEICLGHSLKTSLMVIYRNAGQSGNISAGDGRTSMFWRHIGHVPC